MKLIAHFIHFPILFSVLGVGSLLANQTENSLCSDVLKDSDTSLLFTDTVIAAIEQEVLSFSELEVLLESTHPFNPITLDTTRSSPYRRVIHQLLETDVDWSSIRSQLESYLEKKQKENVSTQNEKSSVANPNRFELSEDVDWVSASNLPPALPLMYLNNGPNLEPSQGLFEIEGPSGKLLYTIQSHQVVFVEKNAPSKTYRFSIKERTLYAPSFFKIGKTPYVAIATHPSEINIFEFKPNSPDPIKKFTLYSGHERNIAGPIIVDSYRGQPVIILNTAGHQNLCFVFLDQKLNPKIKCLGLLSNSCLGLTLYDSPEGQRRGIAWCEGNSATLFEFDYHKIESLDDTDGHFFFPRKQGGIETLRGSHLIPRSVTISKQQMHEFNTKSSASTFRSPRGSWIIGSHFGMLSVFDIENETIRYYPSLGTEFLEKPIFYSHHGQDYVASLAFQEEGVKRVKVTLWILNMTRGKWEKQGLDLGLDTYSHNGIDRKVLWAHLWTNHAMYRPSIQLLHDSPIGNSYPSPTALVISRGAGPNEAVSTRLNWVDLVSHDFGIPVKLKDTRTSTRAFFYGREQTLFFILSRVGIGGLFRMDVFKKTPF